MDRNEAISNQHSAISQKEAVSNQHSALSQSQDQDGGTEVEWKPTPDMYRMDTREGIEAYEASFRMKIGASGDRGIATSDQGGHLAIGTPQRAAVPHVHGLPHEQGGTFDPSQMHANQG